jgi:hypothetical protein
LYVVSTVRPRDEPAGAGECIEWLYDATLEVLSTNYAGGPSTELEVVDDRPIDLNGHPGREFRILDPDGAPTQVRIYYVNGTIYRLITDDEDDARAERFLESFDLL